MRKFLNLSLTTIFVFLVFFSCQTAKSQENTPPSPSAGMKGSPLPMMEEDGMMLLMKLDALLNTEDEMLLLTDEQVAAILPVLQEWRDALDEAAGKNADCADAVESELSEEQLDYIPMRESLDGKTPPVPPERQGAPPAGGSGGGDREDRPAGNFQRPGDNGQFNMLSFLEDLIEKMSQDS